ncbi:MAG: hypothetical protein ACOYJR_01860 [Acutalibacteraceae bacterium]|jgi:hypothetical protein
MLIGQGQTSPAFVKKVRVMSQTGKVRKAAGKVIVQLGKELVNRVEFPEF